MRKVWMVMLLLSAACLTWGQNCDQMVDDPGDAFKGRQMNVLEASQALAQKGADVRVRTFVYPVTNLDTVIDTMTKQCDSWHDPSGVRKSTLIVLAVAPTSHKMGVYYGSAWRKALDDHWNRIKQDYMAPRFKDGDFAGGMIITEQQFVKRIEASQDEVIHPQTTTIQEMPTDYSGFWRVLNWLLVLGSFGLVMWGLIALGFRRKREQEEISGEQLRAIQIRNQTARALGDAKRDLAVYQTNPGIEIAQKAYDTASENYARLSGEVKTDPTQDGLTAADYKVIAQAYKDVQVQLITGMDFLIREMKEEKKAPEEPKKEPKKVEVKKEEPVDDTCLTCGGPRNSIEHSPTPPRLGYHPHRPRVREETRSEGDTIIAPVIIGNEFGSREREEEHESRTVDRDDDSSDYERSNRNSGSSSASSSGGSSDYSSDSSDFGSGGSSDFGGGDSGGGGSSDF